MIRFSMCWRCAYWRNEAFDVVTQDPSCGGLCYAQPTIHKRHSTDPACRKFSCASWVDPERPATTDFNSPSNWIDWRPIIYDRSVEYGEGGS